MLFILNVKAVAEHMPSRCISYSQLSLFCQIHIIQYHSFMSLPDSSFLTWQNPDISERNIHYAHTQYKAF